MEQAGTVAPDLMNLLICFKELQGDIMFTSSMRDKNMPKDVDNVGPIEYAGLIGKIQREKFKRKSSNLCGKKSYYLTEKTIQLL